MSRRRKPRRRDPELVRGYRIDPETGLRINVDRRGFVAAERFARSPEEAMAKGAPIGARATIERNRAKIMDHLESKGILTERTEDNATSSDEMFATIDKGESFELRSWAHDAYKKTEPLTFDRACVDYLISTFSILREFDDVQLAIIDEYANHVARLDLLDGDINGLAHTAFQQRKIEKDAGLNSGKTRSTAANERWRNAALEVAKEVRQKNPDFSQEKIAEIIQKSPIAQLPGNRTILRAVRKWEDDGDLPKRIVT
jgi:hypothetical protein